MVEASKRAHWEWKSVDPSKEQSNTLFIAMKVAKLHLRKTQRQLAASERTTLYEDVMSAKTADPQLFYKLVRKQRDSPYSKAADIAFADDLPGENEAQKWASYFAALATPKCLLDYDDEYKKSCTLKRLLLKYTRSSKPSTITKQAMGLPVST